MSVFRGDDKEIDFEEEDTRNQYPDLYETEEEKEREEETIKTCICGHIDEDHIDYLFKCCVCDCQKFEEKE